MFLGQLERVDETCVVGWVANTDGLSDHIAVKVTINGTKITESVANILRPDLVERLGTGDHGFRLEVGPFLQPGYNTVRLEAVGVDFTFENPEREVFYTPTDGTLGQAIRKNPELFLFESLLKRSIDGVIPVRSEVGSRFMARVLENTKLVFILFTNRSGSNVITDMLSHMGIGGGVTHEPFLVDVMKDQIEKHGYTSIEHYLAGRIEAYRKNGTAFFKIGWDALFYLSHAGLFDGALQNSSFIWARRDKLAQAISYIRALKSGIFFEDSSASQPSPLSFKAFWGGDQTVREIAQAHQFMHVADMRLGYFLEMQGLSYFEAFYEDMTRDMPAFYEALRSYVEASTGVDGGSAPFVAKLRKHESRDSQQIKQLYLDLVRLPDRLPVT